MKISRFVLSAAIMPLGFLLAPASAWPGQCRLTEMAVAGRIARAGNVLVDLGEADRPDPSAMSAYQGPPGIRVGNGPACSADRNVSIIFGPLWFGQGKLYVSTYSGSENRLFVIDAKSCRTIWQSRHFTGGPAQYRNGALMLGRRLIRLDGACMVLWHGMDGIR